MLSGLTLSIKNTLTNKNTQKKQMKYQTEVSAEKYLIAVEQLRKSYETEASKNQQK